MSQTVKTFGNPPIPVQDVVDAEGNTYCQVHPETATGLRCNHCERLMCAKCAVSTPVGYRCRECVRAREDVFFNADASAYAAVAAVCTVLGAVGAFVANLVGWFIFVFFVGVAAGGVISEAVSRVTRGKRGRYTAAVAAGGIVVGSVAVMLIGVLPYLAYVQSASLSPEQIQQLIDTYGAERAEAFVQQIRQEQSGTTLRILGAAVFNLSVWLYAGIAAFTVYGRFNIYGRRK